MSVQVIERNGKPEWAVLPYEDYRIRAYIPWLQALGFTP